MSYHHLSEKDSDMAYKITENLCNRFVKRTKEVVLLYM